MLDHYIWNYDDGDDSYDDDDDDDDDDDGDDDDDNNCRGVGKCHDDYFFCGDVDDDIHHGHKDLWNIVRIISLYCKNYACIYKFWLYLRWIVIMVIMICVIEIYISSYCKSYWAYIQIYIIYYMTCM